MTLLPLLLVALTPAPSTDAELAQCAAVMQVYFDSRPAGSWDEERARAMAAASYYTGKLARSVEEVHSAKMLALEATRNLIDRARAKLKEADVQAQGQKCFEEYSFATGF